MNDCFSIDESFPSRIDRLYMRKAVNGSWHLDFKAEYEYSTSLEAI